MKSTVLIVDDAELFRAALAAAVKEAGFEVVATAGDAMAAISLAKRHKPDIVLLDVLMPGMSGLEIVATITSEVPNTAVVLLTYLVLMVIVAVFVDRMRQRQSG